MLIEYELTFRAVETLFQANRSEQSLHILLGTVLEQRTLQIRFPLDQQWYCRHTSSEEKDADVVYGCGAWQLEGSMSFVNLL